MTGPAGPGRGGRRLLRRVLAIGVVAALPAPLHGEAPAAGPARRAEAPRADTLPAGRLIPKVTSSADSARSYALYLPSAYDPARRWPVLVVMDPRGRALLGVDLFRAAAERHGWIVLSSYDTRSDLPDDVAGDPNEEALRAMLADVEARLAFDPRRIYLAGFSGTARLAWVYAERMPGQVAGLIGFGGALFRHRDGEGPEHAFYGGAGRLDFNYQEVRLVGRLLELVSPPVPHRLSFWDGPHGWAPPEICAEAVAWMEVRAMQRGFREAEAARVTEYYRGQLARGAELEAAGRPVEALAIYRSAVRDVEGLADPEEARRRARRLEGSAAVEKRIEALDRSAEEQRALEETLYPMVDRVREEKRVPDPERVLERLGVRELRERAGRAHAGPGSDPEAGTGPASEEVVAAEAAARLLHVVYVQFSFYLPRRLLGEGLLDEALRALEVAEAARPGTPRVCLFRARALAAAGRREPALEAVRCVVEAGLDPGLLEVDPWLEPLRDDPAWRELVPEGPSRPGAR